LLAFEVFYVVVANLFLLTGMPERLVASSSDLHLDYASAYSWWPGHVFAKDVTLRAKDHNVEFSVEVETAWVNIAISDLFLKRFHATTLKTTGTVYKMRHHVFTVGEKALRLAAYPSIEGFRDPPLYVDKPSPPLTDETYNLWEIQLENVNAEIAEVWIMEYRYTGAGTATGKFHLRPARWFEVGPAALELRGGRIEVADIPVAERATGRIDCLAKHTDVEHVEGMAVLHSVSFGVHLTLDKGDLSFADVYTRPTIGAHVSGHANWQIDLSMKDAILQRGSKMTLTARPFEFRKEKAHFGGPVDVTVTVGPDAAPDRILAEVSSSELIGAIRDKETPSPSVHRLRAHATLRPLDVRQDLAVVSKGIEIGRFDAPALSWFDPFFDGTPKLKGSARVSGRFDQDEKKGLRAEVEGAFEHLGVQLGDTALASEKSDLHASIDSAAKGNGRFDVRRFDVEVQNLSMQDGKNTTLPLTAGVRGEGIEIESMDPFAAHGILKAHGDRATALLPLFMDGALLRSVTSLALDLDAIEARAAFRIGNASQRVELLNADSGKLHARGLWQKMPKKTPEGAFLVSAGDINVGVKLENSKTDVKAFAGSDWLPTELRRLALADHAEGTAPLKTR
jgi:hypothetical protein